MGCITSADVKNPKKVKQNKENKYIQPALYKSKMDKSHASKLTTPKAQQPMQQRTQHVSVPRIKKTTSVQFLSLYDITQTLKQSTRLQGPKLLTSKISGVSSVLRVYNGDKINEQRLKQYHQILKFELYTDEEQNYLLVDQQIVDDMFRYCSGQSICELFSESTDEQERQLSHEERRVKQQQIASTILQVYDIIMQFHSQKMFLGNLSLFSFRRLSPYGNEVRLVDFNVDEQETNPPQQMMGHAHHNSYQSDWEFMGYLLQFYLSDKSPVFIPHKMQYVENDQSLAESGLISTLLKGRQVPRKQLEKISVQSYKLTNQTVLTGYRFCRDVLRLIRARRRRMKHKASYYSEEIFLSYRDRHQKQGDNFQEQHLWRLQQLYNPQEQLVLGEENLHRIETERILSFIESYIQRLNINCEQHFINYAMAAESYRKLKEVFLIVEKRQKMDEFRELIPQLK